MTDDGKREQEYRWNYPERPPVVCAAEGCLRNLPLRRPHHKRYCSEECKDRQVGRNRDRRERYGVYGATLEDYDRLLLEQEGKCAICGGTSPGRPGATRFAFDHDHREGRPRGLLCYLCNVGLGSFQDDPALLQAAARYLESHKEADRAISPLVSREQAGNGAPAQASSRNS